MRKKANDGHMNDLELQVPGSAHVRIPILLMDSADLSFLRPGYRVELLREWHPLDHTPAPQ
jgi:hypothetical protein